MTAQRQSGAPDFISPDEAAGEAKEPEWTTVSEADVDESKVTFDELGESFTGTYTGHRTVEGDNGKFVQYRFEHNGEHYFTNAGWSLMQGMAEVQRGELVRITWISERDTGQDTPMRVFRVEVAGRPKHRRPTSRR